MKLCSFFIMRMATLGLWSIADVAAAISVSTKDFVEQVSVANEFEIETSKLALEKSQNKGIKAFAQRMIDDHTKTGKELQSVLESSPSGLEAKEKLDNEHQKIMDKLQSASTDNFNKQYIDVQTDAHKKAVSLFKDYAKNGDDAALKGFATQTLPTLQEHLEHIKRIKNKE